MSDQDRDENGGSKDQDRFPFTAKQAGGVLALVIAFLFVVQNTQTVRVDILFLHVDVQMWLLLVVMFLLGGVVGALFWHRRSRRG